MSSCQSNSHVILTIACLLWSFSSAKAEIAPHFVSGFDRFGKHQELDASLSASLLLTELSCTACHAGEQAELSPKGGPILNAAGTRLDVDWISKFLSDPQSVKPGTTMPDVLHGLQGDEKSEAIRALTAFLGSLNQPFPELRATGLIPVAHEFWLKGDAERGLKLYHSVGCVACHEVDAEYEVEGAQESALDRLLEELDPEELAEMGLSGAARIVNSVPHGELKAKYSLQSLTHFLHDPLRARPSGRMPNLKLLPSEAADIAAYLLKDQGANLEESEEASDAELIAQGRRLFAEMGCANCHQASDVKPTVAAKPLAKVDFAANASCIGSPALKMPAYQLTEEQRQALQKSQPTAAPDASQLVILQANCLACHERNQLGGVGRKRQQYFETVGHVDIGDEGRLPPSLTHVGKKLNPGWFGKVLAGKGDIRPHMTIRMPIFPKEMVTTLPQRLAIADEVDAVNEQQVFGNLNGLAESGRQLLDMGCIQCHPLRGESLASVVGTDLDHVHERVRPAWFKQFLLNPISMKNRTRMPTFFPNGISTNQEILKGDVDRQIAAIWTYLKENEKHPLPEKILADRARSFELSPGDRPIVLRTFMDKAGTHAIAVGFPEKVNIAFDAENCVLVEAWQGRFLDAHGTWFNRFTPLADPLGNKLVALTTEFARTRSYLSDADVRNLRASKPQFRGYRLDKSGLPTFRYDFAGHTVEDQISPGDGNDLVRRLRISTKKGEKSGDSPALSLKLFRGESVKQLAYGSYTVDGGLTVTLKSKVPLEPVLIKEDSQTICLTPIPNQDLIELEVTYKW